MNVFRSFFAFRLEMHVWRDNQYKTGADRENILGQPMLFVCMGICVLSPAHKSEMRGYLVYVLIEKNLSNRFCLNSATAYKIGRSYGEILGGSFKTFLEGSVDLIIYRDYIVNRRFFIYCSLAWAGTEDVHSLMLPIQHFLCRPRRRPHELNEQLFKALDKLCNM